MRILTNIIGIVCTVAFLAIGPGKISNPEIVREPYVYFQDEPAGSLILGSPKGYEYLKFYVSDTLIARNKEEGKLIDYVERYYIYALIEQAFNEIPASVTLAQGILETGANITPPGNNHFGITASGWTGPVFEHKADSGTIRYRNYRTARESYRDRSRLLLSVRYGACIEFSDNIPRFVTCIVESGYAEDPEYRDKILYLIEEYKLTQFDNVL